MLLELPPSQYWGSQHQPQKLSDHSYETFLVDTEFGCYISFTRHKISFCGYLQLLKTGKKNQNIVKYKQLSHPLHNVGFLSVCLSLKFSFT